MDLTTGGEITRGKVTPVPLTATVKATAEAMAESQGTKMLKFTNKKGETLAHHDWIAGVNCDTTNDFGETEEIDEQDIDEIFENDPVETQGEAEETNPTNGSLVENEKETQDENVDMEQVINEMTDELTDEVIPEGETSLDNAEEPEESAEDPAERPL